MQSSFRSTQNQSIWFAITVVILLIAFTLLGGVPAGEQLPVFLVGVLVTAGVTGAFGFATWHLLVRPLPAGYKVTARPIISGTARHVVALLMLIGIINVTVATIWDEIWHAKYGIPFGEDFFWRPHMLMYFGFGVTILTAVYGLYQILFRGKGTLQQRFRADVPFGAAVLAGAFLIYALPADPVWHMIYGVDISAWALPHMILLVMVITMSYCSILVMRTDRPREWSVLRFDLETLWVVLASAGMIIPCLVVMTVDWYGLSSLAQPNNVTNRAEWMLPAIITFLVAFIGVVTLRASKTAGSATAVGIVALLGRMVMDSALQSDLNGASVLWTALPLLVALDLLYGISIRGSGKAPSTRMTVLVLGVTVLIAMLPVMTTQFVYPQVNAGNIALMAVVCILVGMVAVWLGEVSGEFLATAGISASDEQPSMRRVWMDAAVYAGFAVFMVYFMATAAPPIAG